MAVDIAIVPTALGELLWLATKEPVHSLLSSSERGLPMKKRLSKLALHRETVRKMVSSQELKDAVVGGMSYTGCAYCTCGCTDDAGGFSCDPPCPCP